MGIKDFFGVSDFKEGKKESLDVRLLNQTPTLTLSNFPDNFFIATVQSLNDVLKNSTIMVL